MKKFTWNNLKVLTTNLEEDVVSSYSLVNLEHDLVISAKTVAVLNQLKYHLAREFQIKDLGTPKFVLAVQIIETSEGIFLFQEA